MHLALHRCDEVVRTIPGRVALDALGALGGVLINL